MESRAAPQQRELGQFDIEPPRLGFRKDRDFLARLDLAQAEDGVERRNPAFLNAVGEHVRSLLPGCRRRPSGSCSTAGRFMVAHETTPG